MLSCNLIAPCSAFNAHPSIIFLSKREILFLLIELHRAENVSVNWSTTKQMHRAKIVNRIG